MRIATITLTLLAVGCTVDLPSRTTYYPSGADRERIAEVVVEWEAAGLPEVDEDRCDLLHLQVSVVGAKRFRSLCTACAPSQCPNGRASLDCDWGCGYECASYLPVSATNGRWPIVIVSDEGPYADDLTAAIDHGLRHLLGSQHCTGAGLDRLHEDARRWGR